MRERPSPIPAPLFDAENDIHATVERLQLAVIVAEMPSDLGDENRKAVARVIDDALCSAMRVRDAWLASHQTTEDRARG